MEEQASEREESSNEGTKLKVREKKVQMKEQSWVEEQASERDESSVGRKSEWANKPQIASASVESVQSAGLLAILPDEWCQYKKESNRYLC